jgi:hypothetical protein
LCYCFVVWQNRDKILGSDFYPRHCIYLYGFSLLEVAFAEVEVDFAKVEVYSVGTIYQTRNAKPKRASIPTAFSGNRNFICTFNPK